MELNRKATAQQLRAQHLGCRSRQVQLCSARIPGNGNKEDQTPCRPAGLSLQFWREATDRSVALHVQGPGSVFSISM